MRIESCHRKYLQCSTQSTSLQRTTELMSQSHYNFEVLKLQFVALSSPYLRCCRETYPRPHGITVKTAPSPRCYRGIRGIPAVPITVQLSTTRYLD